MGAALPPRPRPLVPFLLSLLVALPTAGWLPGEGKRHPPPEFYAQEVPLTLWSKSRLKEAPQTNKQTPQPW